MSAGLVHSMGAGLCGALCLVGVARTAGDRRQRRRVRRRLGAALPEAAPGTPGPGEDGTAAERGAGPGDAARRVVLRSAVRRWLPVVGSVCAGYVLVGGGLGCLLGALGGGGVWWWRRPVTPREADADRAARELPLAADLLAACIAAGAGPVTAAQVVGESLGGPAGERLAQGAAELRLGSEPAVAWRQLAEVPGAAPLARLLGRASESGAPAAAPVARFAAAARAERGLAATATARRAAVLITAPVGLCFLPAFIAVGVLPVVIGLAGGLLSGGGR